MLGLALSACVLAVSATAADALASSAAVSGPWARIVSARAGSRLEFKLGGDLPEELDLRVSLTDPDGRTSRLPAMDIAIDGAGTYKGPEIPAGTEGWQIEIEVIDRRSGRVVAGSIRTVT